MVKKDLGGEIEPLKSFDFITIINFNEASSHEQKI
jgi:hypothetical protein